ncbi:OLC1v1016962C1 [Oldenlandia corymbosa var. corymbosa]|uniref:OLC1v1016962C1 n=1 Tax=Oldenlandia corymbosa var. corymbosa TaxID=529605 RepID=A0AAV1E8E8_OLDCO|nr:OLC1v1016962C1 [Oldenlandia corymbosa var. corymbosa]
MSCNGCRVLRRGCSERCPLRPCLDWIDTPKAQSNATLFVSKFFGRSDLMSFISAVPDSKRSALFQSLLFEACGRTVNPVSGAVGLLSTGNWHVCQSAVETVLAGGTLRPMFGVVGNWGAESDEASEKLRGGSWRAKCTKEYFVHGSDDDDEEMTIEPDRRMSPASETDVSELSASYGCYDGGAGIGGVGGGKEPKLLNLFV